MIIRKPYEKLKNRPITLNDQPSLTKEAFAADLDVNRIIKKYQTTGILQQATDFEAQYGDFTGWDLQESLNKINDAHDLFMKVPSEIRSRFGNDAGAFIDFATNPENLPELRNMGLAHPEKPQPKSDPTPDPTPAKPAVKKDAPEAPPIS